MLVVVLSHFSELKSELELLRSERNADLIEDRANALWTQVRTASDFLASHVPPSGARSPPSSARDE
jgi:hypothetical protein